MDEQQTFDRLKRIPFEEMRDKWKVGLAAIVTDPREYSEELDKFFQQYGWTVSDYVNAHLVKFSQ